MKKSDFFPAFLILLYTVYIAVGILCFNASSSFLENFRELKDFSEVSTLFSAQEILNYLLPILGFASLLTFVMCFFSINQGGSLKTFWKRSIVIFSIFFASLFALGVILLVSISSLIMTYWLLGTILSIILAAICFILLAVLVFSFVRIKDTATYKYFYPEKKESTESN